MTLEEITTAMRDRVDGDSGLDATLKFDFGDDGVVFIDGVSDPNTVSNDDEDADCTIKISRDNFLKLVDGDLEPTTAFMMGKIKISGSMGVAMKLQSLLK